jgi:nucleoside-diphosphate-sugar epimerase
MTHLPNIPPADIAQIATLDDLDHLLSRPSTRDVDCLRCLHGDVLILGAGGKMGPSLARRLSRASREAGTQRRIVAVSRFSSAGARNSFERAAIETMVCDLLDRAAVDRLPRFPLVIYLAGRKFGTSDRPDLTWAINALAPVHVAEFFAGSRVVYLSTGNVYAPVPVAGTGSTETDTLEPHGDYARSCVARERLIEYVSRERAAPCALVRLNYAVDLRYGVVMDVGRRVFSGEPVDLTVGYFNAIWQGDAVSYTIRVLEHCASPPFVINVTGAEKIRVRDLANAFGERFGRAPRFCGGEGATALLSDANRCHTLLGPPDVSFERLFDWAARWIEIGGATLNKPTAYDVTDGVY